MYKSHIDISISLQQWIFFIRHQGHIVLNRYLYIKPELIFYFTYLRALALIEWVYLYMEIYRNLDHEITFILSRNIVERVLYCLCWFIMLRQTIKLECVQFASDIISLFIGQTGKEVNVKVMISRVWNTSLGHGFKGRICRCRAQGKLYSLTYIYPLRMCY